MSTYPLFQVTIAKVGGTLFSGDAVRVSVPSVEGIATILAHHEPLIALLKEGVVLVEDSDGVVNEFTIEKGLLEVSGNKAFVLI